MAQCTPFAVPRNCDRAVYRVWLPALRLRVRRQANLNGSTSDRDFKCPPLRHKPLDAVQQDSAQPLDQRSVFPEQNAGRHLPCIEQETIMLGIPAVGVAIIARGKAGSLEEFGEVVGGDRLCIGEEDDGLVVVPAATVIIFNDPGPSNDA